MFGFESTSDLLIVAIFVQTIAISLIILTIYLKIRKIQYKNIDLNEKIDERGMENGLYNVKALLEGTGSIPVYITLEAYRKVLKEKERLKCSVSEAIVEIINQNQQQATVAKSIP